MSSNILSNTEISESYERRLQVEKLTPIGREIIENYKAVRVDSKTIKLVKPDNYVFKKNEKLSRKRKHSKNKK
ncbi:MAG: hypothetical protein PHW22_04185 [Bacilli bacterium]|nr:hypothetical protein [Bacilli bacterium]